MHHESQPQQKRILFLGVIGLCWAIVLIARLLYLQTICHGEYQKMARQQQMKVEEIPAPRGTIVDRHGNTLAMTLPVESVCVNPMRLPDPQTAAEVFARILDLDRAKLYEDLKKAIEQRRGFLWIKRRITDEQARSLKSLPFDWIEFRKETSRRYPNGTTAAHVLGSVDHEERGNAGIEQSMDSVLRGKPGLQRMLTDSRRRGYDSEIIEHPRAGTNLRLTIDTRIQFAAEQSLSRAVRENRAWTGSLVVMDPKTGEVLAMANYPTFDPNTNPTSEAELKARQNLSISAPYEPGSVFKVITLAAALETTRLRPDSLIDCGHGRMKLFTRVIHDHDPYGTLTLAEVLAKSSNVGAIKAGLAVGEEKLYEYVRRFGFGQLTGIPLPSESAGRVWPLKMWQATSIGSVAMGHEVMATNLQLARAAAVIANGGYLVQPRLILSRKAPDGPEVPEPVKEPVRALRPETAAKMASMMEGVVRAGTGKNAQPAGYSAAGKTGSAQIWNPQLRRYTSQYNASFMGFAPLNNPRVVIVVTLNGATKYGGTVAAPVFREVAAEALRILDVRKDLPETLPDETEDRNLATNDLPPAFDDPGEVTDEAPRIAGASLKTVRNDGEATPPPVQYASTLRVPDFTGKTLRKVLEESTASGIQVEWTGYGIARAQDPPAGSVLMPGERVRVQFAR
ncbi:MAG: transpeptidase family protein [Bryobacteraceae bacterium]|nr:transpeptidase family protein [Bryobacteraceae bacterium]